MSLAKSLSNLFSITSKPVFSIFLLDDSSPKSKYLLEFCSPFSLLSSYGVANYYPASTNFFVGPTPPPSPPPSDFYLWHPLLLAPNYGSLLFPHLNSLLFPSSVPLFGKLKPYGSHRILHYEPPLHLQGKPHSSSNPLIKGREVSNSHLLPPHPSPCPSQRPLGSCPVIPMLYPPSQNATL